MQGHYHAAVWIDGHEARVFRFNAEDVDSHVIHRHHSDKEHRREKQSGHANPDDAQFLDSVAAALGDAGAILVTGPGVEKTAFLKHLELKHPKQRKAVEAIETSDHPTDNELVAHARKTLHAADRMRPQS